MANLTHIDRHNNVNYVFQDACHNGNPSERHCDNQDLLVVDNCHDLSAQERIHCGLWHSVVGEDRAVRIGY